MLLLLLLLWLWLSLLLFLQLLLLTSLWICYFDYLLILMLLIFAAFIEMAGMRGTTEYGAIRYEVKGHSIRRHIFLSGVKHSFRFWYSVCYEITNIPCFQNIPCHLWKSNLYSVLSSVFGTAYCSIPFSEELGKHLFKRIEIFLTRLFSVI